MNKRIIPVLLLTFVNTIGFTILIPILPFLTDKYGGGVFVFGLLLSAYSLSQFFAAPLLGSLSDKYGRRPILILSQAGTLLSWIIFSIAYFVPAIPIGAISLPIIIILLSRIADGITGGNISVANAYLADITEQKERTKYFGLMGATFGLGFVIGPLIGGLSSMSSIDYLGTAILASIISMITLFAIIFYLPESLKQENRTQQLKIKLLQEINIFKKIKSYQNNPTISYLFKRKIFFSFGMTCFTTTFVLYAKDTLSLSALSLSLLLTFIGLSSVFNQSFIVQKVSKKIGDKKTFNLGQVIFGISLFSLFLQPNLYLFIFILYFTNLGTSLSMPSFKSLLTNSADKKQIGQVNGLDESIMAGSHGTAPTLASALYGTISYFSFIIFSLIILIPFVFKKKKPII